MDSLKITGLAILIFGGMSSVVLAETKGKTDECLVTLYNYPAEAPQYSVTKKTLPKLPLVLEKNKRASKTSEPSYSRMSLSPESTGEK